MKRLLIILTVISMIVTLASCKKSPDTEFASPAANDEVVTDTVDTKTENDMTATTEQDGKTETAPATETNTQTESQIPSVTDTKEEPEAVTGTESLPEEPKNIIENDILSWNSVINEDDFKIDGSLASHVTGRVESEYGFAKLSLAKVDGWEYLVEEYTDGCEWFGISIKPEGEYGYIHVEYRVSQIGFCGTGMGTLKIKLGDTDAAVSAYGSMWDHISILDPYQSCIIMHEYIDSWWDEYKHEAMYILSTIEFRDDIITSQQAIKSVEALERSQYVYGNFDPVTGEWVLLENGEVKARVDAIINN